MFVNSSRLRRWSGRPRSWPLHGTHGKPAAIEELDDERAKISRWEESCWRAPGCPIPRGSTGSAGWAALITEALREGSPTSPALQLTVTSRVPLPASGTTTRSSVAVCPATIVTFPTATPITVPAALSAFTVTLHSPTTRSLMVAVVPGAAWEENDAFTGTVAAHVVACDVHAQGRHQGASAHAVAECNLQRAGGGADQGIGTGNQEQARQGCERQRRPGESHASTSILRHPD